MRWKGITAGLAEFSSPSRRGSQSFGRNVNTTAVRMHPNATR